MSREDVRLMLAETQGMLERQIEESARVLREAWGGALQGSRQEVAAEIGRHREELGIHRNVMAEQDTRINTLIEGSNLKMSQLEAEILSHRADMDAHKAAIVE